MNETRITDYALNELQGDEREKFESDLAADQRLQTDLHAASRVADGLAQIMGEPGEGLEPQAREKLLRAITENQQALRQRRKIVRFAVPISLAAAASIAVLLLVVGGKTTQGPAVAAADGLESAEIQWPPEAQADDSDDPLPHLNRGLTGGFTAKIRSNQATFTFRGTGDLSSESKTVQITKQPGDSAEPTEDFSVEGIRTTYAEGRTITMSESARVAQELREDAGLSLTSPAVRMKPLIWDEDLTRLGSNGEQP